MKTLIVTLSCLLLCFSAAVAEAPPMQVPLAPQISAAKALELADAYVAKTFPKDSSLYCQSVHLQEASVRPVRAYRHWDLVYRHAGAARSMDEKSGKETFGDFHVYVTMTGDISHELVSLIAVIPVLRDSGDGTPTGLAIAQEIPTGKLGFPVGTYLRIEGARVEGIKTGERTLRVDTVNGKKLDKSIEVAVENVESLPKGGRCILRGYETGQMIGTPPALEQAAKEEGRDIPLPQAGWEFRRHFVVISVVEPKNLVLTNTGSGENTTPATAQAIVAGLVAELGALAANHAELAGFPEYVKRLESDQAVEFKTHVMPLALTFQKNVSPVLTKRHIRPSDCGTNGIFFQFVLDDGTNPRQAPADTVTHLPNLKLILYADLVLWEKASPELRKELAGIMARHQGMLIELDKKAANKPDELEILPAAPQGDVERPFMRSGKLLPALPAGKLGFAVGTNLQIEGTRVEGLKTGERTLLVDTINGKKLEAPMEIEIGNFDSVPKDTRCVLRGYETGHMIGTPPAREQAAKEEGREKLTASGRLEFSPLLRRHVGG